MSKILAILAAHTKFGAKVQRTIEHSPSFSDDQSTDEAGRPATRIPPGGFLTG